MSLFTLLISASMLVTSIGLVISRDWRKHVAFMALQYIAMFLLLRDHWPFTMAAAKLITGWMAIAAIGMSQVRLDEAMRIDTSWPEGRTFRYLTSALVVLAVFAVTPQLSTFLPGISQSEVFGGGLLIGMGLLQLGITIQPLRVILGLLTVLCGFEIMYATVENSIVVAALLSAVNLGLALLGAYLLNLNAEERT